MTAGFYYVTHREALSPSRRRYQADTTLPLVAVVSHSAVPTLAFEATMTGVRRLSCKWTTSSAPSP